MAKVRQDAWSHEDDLLLAETVLRHIREGSTQLDAFEEVGDKLNRTGAACGFRWNAIVRKKYESAIEIAKKQRKQRKREEQRMARSYQPNARPHYTPAETQTGMGFSTEQTQASQEVLQPAHHEQESQMPVGTSSVSSEIAQELTMGQVVHYLQNLQASNSTSTRLEKENQTLREQNEMLTKKVNDLEKVISKLKRDYQTVEEDYQSLIGIMERARRMVILQEQDEKGPSFKMDKNGNLEKLAK